MNARDFNDEPPLPPLQARSAGPRIERLYALLTQDAEGEGVVRRNTPAGPQPLITSDPALARALRDYVRAHHFPHAWIAVFRREP